MKIEVGDTVRLRCQFTDSAGVPVDPSGVAVEIVLPSGKVYSGIPTRESAGVYVYDYEVEEPGYHTVRWQGSGTYQASARDSFFAGE